MTKQHPLTEAQANAVYDVLVRHAGEIEDDYSREHFVYAQSTSWEPEYRFMGGLGFGGKFRRDMGRAYVDCYRESLTPERERMIEDTNKTLKELFDE